MTTKFEIRNSEEAEIALRALLAWAASAHPAVAILLRRCLIRLLGTRSCVH